MKLVEILARDLKEWPEGAVRASYGADMNVYFEKIDGGIIETSYFTRGVDIPPFDVTLPQWQAERDRMKAMGTQQATASTEPTYEQQLWDRVAVAATQAFITSHITHYGHGTAWQDTELVSCAAGYADAFMAERAKRVGK